MVEKEVEDQTRLVLNGEHFVALKVFVAATPFATHIFPLRHMASFGDTSGVGNRRPGASAAVFAGEDICRAGESGSEFHDPQRPSGVCRSEALSLVR